MDRREALSRLGAAGAIIAGGSAVLSSNDVAFAASGECLLAGVPTPIDMQISRSRNEKDLTIAPALPNPPTGVTITRIWSGAGPVAPPTGPVTISGSTTGPTVILERPNNPAGGKWILGESFTVTLQVTWSCVGLLSSVGTYVISSTLVSPPYTESVIAN